MCGRCQALIIAIGDYNDVSDIAGAVDNGRDWVSWLSKSQRLRGTNIQMLFDDRATKENIEDAAHLIGDRAKSGERVWLVFIGHGAPSKDGQEGLLLGLEPTGQGPSLESGLGICGIISWVLGCCALNHTLDNLVSLWVSFVPFCHPPTPTVLPSLICPLA